MDTGAPMERGSTSDENASGVPSLALESAVRRIGQVVRGKDEVVRLALIGLLARGHVLLEDVPGVGKTTLARALAKAVGGSFNRIQLTADLLPADIVGGSIPDTRTGQIQFRPGPIFANVVLADELNRATPRTQSGLLEAMAERAISVDGQTHRLPDPFLVLATQNPVEHHGVYVLPQSQMDRFLIRTAVGYPDDEVETALIVGDGIDPQTSTVESIQPVLKPDGLEALFNAVDEVTLEASVARYLQAVVKATRTDSALSTGVSTRGALQYAKACRARALVQGRRFVTPDDVHALAVPVCAHRVILAGQDRPTRRQGEAVIEEILAQVPVPV